MGIVPLSSFQVVPPPFHHVFSAVAGLPFGRRAGSCGASVSCCHGGDKLHDEAEAGSGGEEESHQPAADCSGVSASHVVLGAVKHMIRTNPWFDRIVECLGWRGP